jgi:site-specific DNA recombinase
MIRVIFAWVGLERVSLREIYRRLQQADVRIHRGTVRMINASTLA